MSLTEHLVINYNLKSDNVRIGFIGLIHLVDHTLIAFSVDDTRFFVGDFLRILNQILSWQMILPRCKQLPVQCFFRFTVTKCCKSV